MIEGLKSKKIRVVELYAGSATFSQTAKSLGCETLSIDNVAYPNVDLVADMLDKTTLKKIVAFRPDILHASPPCQGFSTASGSHHFRKVDGEFVPWSTQGALSIALMLRVFEILRAIKKEHGYVPVWFIENPMSKLRKMRFMADAPIRHTITMCRYGMGAMKATDIWTNCKGWVPRPKCRNGGWGKSTVDGVTWCLDEAGNPCHQEARRGARTGTQGLKGAHARATFPVELCEDLLEAGMRRVEEKRKIVANGENLY